MATRKQIRANRANAQKSTGPITDEGKAITAQNAVTHALHATKLIIDSPHYKEDPEEYNQLLASLIWELRPGGIMQHHLVHKIATAMWRYRRVIRAETGAIKGSMSYFDLCVGDENEEAQATFLDRHSLPNTEDSLKILRYELRLDRQLTRAYKLLRHLQLLEEAKSRQENHRDREKRQNKVNSP